VKKLTGCCSFFVVERGLSENVPPGVAGIGAWVLRLAFAGTEGGIVEAQGVTEAAEEKDAACYRNEAEERDAACSLGGVGRWAVPEIEEDEIAARGEIAAEQGETGAGLVWFQVGWDEPEAGLDGYPVERPESEAEWVERAGFEVVRGEFRVEPVAFGAGRDESRVGPAAFEAGLGEPAARLDDSPVERLGG
jgi:hypothetical protein